ncbi:uncharacterized protein METZ01_LOCUS441377, partial [marine metagenome]
MKGPTSLRLHLTPVLILAMLPQDG